MSLKEAPRGLIVISTLALAALAGCGGGAASPAVVAKAAGATNCTDSGFYIESKLGGGREEIYNCHFSNRLPGCVTYSGNIASLATQEVSFVFSNAIGNRPACLRQHRVAVAALTRLRAAAALARRKREYNQALAFDRQSGWHKGYTAWNGNPATYTLPTIYWKWVPGSYACPSYDTTLGYTCWKVEVVTRHACSDLSVELGEHTSGNANSPQVGTVDGYAGSVSPWTPTVVEVDGDTTSGQWAFVNSITCL